MQMKPLHIGLLPLYIKLYDDVDPALRTLQMPFLSDAAKALEAEGMTVTVTDVCRVKDEFERAVARLNDQKVSAVVTLHLAYSPSLEAIDALAKLKAPIILMDTTPTFDFITEAGAQAIDRNHGIHGVQDLCSMLRRRGIPYHLACGPLEDGSVTRQVAGLCRAAQAAETMRHIKVGLIGGAFDGMGDFRLDAQTLTDVTGAEVVCPDPAELRAIADTVTDTEVDEQLAEDAQQYTVEVSAPEHYRSAVRAGLTLRRWAERDRIGAVTLNFMQLSKATGLSKMPFAELSRMMAHGYGYAGEGDVLTAALTGALMTAYETAGFVEIFCPDWARGILLLSHMAEMNLALAEGKPLLTDVPFAFTDAGDTVGVFGRHRAGRAVLVNLAPLRADRFSLLLTEVDMLSTEWDETPLRNQIRGWMKPRMPLPEFLRRFSLAGGTHHSALVYNGDINSLAAFGEMMGFSVTVI